MKLKFLTISLVLITIIACHQTAKEDSTSSAEKKDTLKKVAISDTSNREEQSPGVYFINLKDGAKLKSPLIIQMGVRGMAVEHSGLVHEGKGHHHLIIDDSFIEKGQIIPNDETHIHFGKGQTTDTLKLSPGIHTLTLQFANGAHESYGKDWSKTISITVVNTN